MSMLIVIFVVFLVLLSFGTGWYFISQGTKSKASDSKMDSDDSKTESDDSKTESALKKYYTNKETFRSIEGLENTLPNIEMNATLVSIWNDIQKIVPESYTKSCGDDPFKISYSAMCYTGYQDYIEQPLDNDTRVALIMLNVAFDFEMFKQVGKFEEIKQLTLTDVISYDANTKIVNVKAPRVAKLPDDIRGSYSLESFISKLKDFKFGAIEESKDESGNVNGYGLRTCTICGVDYFPTDELRKKIQDLSEKLFASKTPDNSITSL